MSSKMPACYFLSCDFQSFQENHHVDIITAFVFKKIRGKNIFDIRDILKAELTTITLFSSSSTLSGFLDCLQLKRVIITPNVSNTVFSWGFTGSLKSSEILLLSRKPCIRGFTIRITNFLLNTHLLALNLSQNCLVFDMLLRYAMI